MAAAVPVGLVGVSLASFGRPLEALPSPVEVGRHTSLAAQIVASRLVDIA